MPTSIATVRSNITVSPNVSSSTMRSPTGPLHQVPEALDLGHVPGHDHQHGGQRGQRHVAHQRRQHQHEQQQEYRMQDAGKRRARAGADIGGGAGDGAGGRQAAEQRRGDVCDALGDQFAVGAMPAADHAVGDDCGQQRFDAGKEGDRECTGKQFARAFERNVRKAEVRQRRGNAAEARADRLDRQMDEQDRAAAPAITANRKPGQFGR